jgi:hypothetical protein
MANLLVQAINAGDGDQAARIVQNAVGIESDDAVKYCGFASWRTAKPRVARMRRREFIAYLGAMAAVPLAALREAQGGNANMTVPVVRISLGTFDADKAAIVEAKLMQSKATLESWTVLKTWSIGSISDSIGLDGFGAKACGGSQGFSTSMIG